MKFLKENSYDIVKLFINQIGIAIFSMALYSAVSIALPGDDGLSSTIEICISIFATLFYMLLVYTAMWEIGAKDRIRMDGGKMVRKPFKGLLMGIVANAPNFLLCGFAMLAMGLYLLNGVEWLKGVFAVLNLLFGFIESMYLGVVINIFPIAGDATAYASDTIYFYRTIAYFLMPVIAISITSLGYFLGVRNLRILSVFSQEKSNSQK